LKDCSGRYYIAIPPGTYLSSAEAEERRTWECVGAASLQTRLLIHGCRCCRSGGENRTKFSNDHSCIW